MPVSLYWLCLLPLAASVGASLARRQHTLAVGLGLAASLACIWLALGAPVGQESMYLGQQWALDQPGQLLLVSTYGTAAILLVIASFAGQVEWFCGPALASTGLLSAAVMLRTLPLSLVLLPAAQLVMVLSVRDRSRTEMQGASRFTAWVALPAVCVPFVFVLLERFALSSGQSALAQYSAWLTVPPAILWLGLFPSDGATRLWSRDGLPLGPVFLWTAKDMVVVYLLLALWRQYPPLQSSQVSQVLGVAAFVTAIYGGVLAFAQSSPAAVLACAATSSLGFALEGLVSGSVHAASGGLYLLVSRVGAVLLASSAVAAMPYAVLRESESETESFRWRTTLLLAAFAVALLTMIGVPPLGSFVAKRQVYGTLQMTQPFLLLAWLSASAGTALGTIRAGWSLWHTKTQAPNTRLYDLPLLFVICLLLLFLSMELRPQTVTTLISECCQGFMHLLSLTQTSGCSIISRAL
jgi:hypothetical protein